MIKLLEQILKITDQSYVKDCDIVTDKERSQFKSVIKSLETFVDFSQTVSVFSLIGWFFTEYLSIKFCQNR